MRKFLIATVALGGILGLAGGAMAQPMDHHEMNHHEGREMHERVAQHDYYWHHHHYHHRNWDHGHWRYWDSRAPLPADRRRRGLSRGAFAWRVPRVVVGCAVTRSDGHAVTTVARSHWQNPWYFPGNILRPRV